MIVLGGNGSGKTTLLRCVNRTLTPSSGEVWLNGTNITHLQGERLRRARMELAMISQHASLVRRRSALSNVATGALGRHFTAWTAIGGLPAEELQPGAWLPGPGRTRRSGAAAGRNAIRGAGATRGHRPRVGAKAESPPRRRTGGESGSRSGGRNHAPAAPPRDRRSALPSFASCTKSSLAYAFADRAIGIREGRIAFDLARADMTKDAVKRLYISEAA